VTSALAACSQYSPSKAAPALEVGNRVDVYVGAKVLGEVRVGHDAKIGANCVVTSDIAPGCDAVVAPGRIIPAPIVSAFGPRFPPSKG
jgi:serine O-acetyltransferase